MLIWLWFSGLYEDPEVGCDLRCPTGLQLCIPCRTGQDLHLLELAGNTVPGSLFVRREGAVLKRLQLLARRLQAESIDLAENA